MGDSLSYLDNLLLLLKELGHAISGKISTEQMCIEFTKISK